MSFYTSGVKTHYYEPTVDSQNSRSIFKLEADKVLFSTFRVLNIGDADTQQTNNNGMYPYFAGALNNVRSIGLYDGTRKLDEIRETALWSAFKNVNQPNQKQKGMNRLTKNAIGYTYRYPDNDDNALKVDLMNNAVRKNDGTDQEEMWLDLKDLLPLLKASEIVPTNVFKHLTLVIEYKKEYATSKTTRPILAVDELVNTEATDELMKKYQGVEWKAIEHDLVFVALTASSDVPNGSKLDKKVRATLKGFNDKRVGRVVMCKQGISSPADQTNIYESRSLFNEAHQVRVNGRNLFGGAGLDTNAKINAMCVETWGSMARYAPALKQTNAHLPALVGHDAFVGYDLGLQRIQDYQIQMDYSIPKGSQEETDVYGSSFNLHFFGEVVKVLKVMPDMSYDIVYA